MGRYSHLERPWMGLHWSPLLDSQRGTFQQLGSPVSRWALCSGIPGGVWLSECQSAGRNPRKGAVSHGWAICLQRCKEGMGCPRFSWHIGHPDHWPQVRLWLRACGHCATILTPLCLPQATYVLLALAWVFVPIYISSEVSLLLGLRAASRRPGPYSELVVVIGGTPRALITSW